MIGHRHTETAIDEIDEERDQELPPSSVDEKQNQAGVSEQLEKEKSLRAVFHSGESLIHSQASGIR